MPIITLTSDWGTKDPVAAIIKGIILSNIPNAVIVDISHEIASFDYMQAHYVLKAAFPFYPKNTIHLVGLENNNNKESPNPVAIKFMDQYFIGNDIGIFSLMFGDITEDIVEIDVSVLENRMFLVGEVLVKAAIHLARGGKLEDLGTKKDKLTKSLLPLPRFESNSITGNVIYIDKFENLITNISKELFEKVGQGRKFNIIPKSPRNNFRRFAKAYYDINEAELFAYFNTEDLLEIAMSLANAASLLGVKVNDNVRIEFDDSSNR
ncbi:MAG: SAM-dependent chlorinase/fluorinase [Bacteroidota bacterium]